MGESFVNCNLYFAFPLFMCECLKNTFLQILETTKKSTKLFLIYSFREFMRIIIKKNIYKFGKLWKLWKIFRCLFSTELHLMHWIPRVKSLERCFLNRLQWKYCLFISKRYKKYLKLAFFKIPLWNCVLNSDVLNSQQLFRVEKKSWTVIRQATIVKHE